MKKISIAALACIVSILAGCATTTSTPQVDVASATYNQDKVLVTMANGQYHQFDRREVCGRTRGEVGGNGFTIKANGGPVRIGGVRVAGLICPYVSSGGSGRGSSAAHTAPVAGAGGGQAGTGTGNGPVAPGTGTGTPGASNSGTTGNGNPAPGFD